MYVYIFEDLTTQKHEKPPTEIDLSMIEDGTLMVLKCDNVKEVNEDGSLSNLQSCVLESTTDGKYHSPT
jgi:hypothetical protein